MRAGSTSLRAFPGFYGSRGIVFFGILLLVACGGDPVAPEDRLELLLESEHFLYYGVPDDEPVDTVYQERHFRWASQRLAIAPRAKISYYKYRDQDHLAAVTGHDRGSGFAEPESYRFHSIWPRDSHEYIHVLFHGHFGISPPPLFSEGLAVAHHGSTFGDGPLEGDPCGWAARFTTSSAISRHPARSHPFRRSPRFPASTTFRVR